MSDLSTAVFSWAHAERLLWLWAMLPLGGWAWWGARRWAARWDRLADGALRPGLRPSGAVRLGRESLLFGTVLALLVVAAAGPRFGYEWRDVKRRGVDLVVAVDVSASMLAQDISPSRIERARRKISDLLDMLTGDRVGLVAFAGQAFAHCPLTVDYGAVRLFLDDLGPGLVATPGTNLADAIRVSVQALVKGGENAGRGRAVLLITDGEDHGGEVDAAVAEAKEAGARIYVVGIGDPAGAPIPEEGGGFKKDASGNVVLTKFDEAALRRVAEGSGGVFARSAAGDVDLESVYANGIKASLEDSEVDSSREKLWHERFAWPVVVALGLLIGDAWRRQRRARVFTRGPLARWTLTATLMAGIGGIGGIGGVSLGTTSAWAGDVSLREAHKAYGKKDYETALKGFSGAVNSDPADLESVYNESVAQYQLGRYREAAEGFRQSAGSADPAVRQRSLYNLGNALVGQEQLKEAAESYEKALGLDPKDQDARENLSWVRQQIQKQEQQQQQQQDQKQQDQKQDPKQDPKQQQGQQGQQDQQGQSQDQKREQAQGQNQREQKGQQAASAMTPEEAENVLRQVDDSAQRRRYGRPDARNRKGGGAAPGGADW